MITKSLETTKNDAKDLIKTIKKLLDVHFIIESTVMRLLRDFSIQFVYSKKTKNYFFR